MKTFFKFLISLFSLALLAFCLISLALPLWSTPSPSQFNATPDVLYVNWTNNYNGSLTLGNNDTFNLTLSVLNSTSSILNNLFRPADFSVYNGTELNNNVTITEMSTQLVNLIFNVTPLLPGRYNGTVTIVNATDATYGNITNLILTLDVPAYVNSSGIKEFSGNITNSTLEIYYFIPSNITDVAGMRINLTDLDTSLNLTLYDSSSNIKESSIVNLTVPLAYIFPEFPVPSSYWHFTIINFTTQNPITFNGTLELLKASLRINTTNHPEGAFDPDTSDSLENITLKYNRGINGTLSAIFWINNTADYDITINITNSTFLNYTGEDSKKYVEFLFNLTNGTIPHNTANFTEIEFYIDTTKTGDWPGLYRSEIFIDSDKGYPYKTFKLSLFINLTRELNTKLINISNTTVNPGQVVSVNVSTKYINDTNLINLDIKNFTSWLYIQLPGGGYKYDLTLSNTSPIEISPGLYQFNLTVPSSIPGGNYTLYINVTDEKDKNYGISSFGLYNTTNALIINTSGLWMETSKTSMSIEKGKNDTFTIFVNNYGSVDASSSINAYATGVCSLVEGSWSFNITKWNFTSLVNRTWTVKGNDVGSCKVYVNGSSPWFRNITIDVSVSAPSPVCGNGICEAGETPENCPSDCPPLPPGNVTYAYDIAFTKVESLITIQQNSTNSTIVIVKNTGNTSLTVNFGIEGINPAWYTLNSTSATLTINATAAFLVNFRVGIVEMGDYGGIFKATTTNKSISSPFILRVLASEANKTYIRDSLTAYKTQMLNLSNIINQSKQQGYNTSLAESKLEELQEKIQEAEGYVARGDYYNAYNLLKVIETLIEEVNEEISRLQKIIKEEEEKKAFEWVTYALIIAGIAGAGILVYLFWPTKPGYVYKKKKYIYKPKRKEIREKLKEKWTKMTRKKK